jgi:sugar/nucleoside kinase (ribokinase family)
MAAGDVRVELHAPGVEVVDGSGAGDAFAAGFICGFVEGWSLERSFAFATAVGASACTALGCTAGVFSRQQAEDFVIGHSLARA